ncbi:MAG: MATE family efflux transporter [Hydrogenoanaerobacterium sp.]
MAHSDYIIKRVFRKYLFFSIVAAMVLPLGMLVDGIVISNFLGKEAMAAVGLVSPLFLLLSAFSGIIASGSTSLCGQYIGKEQPENVKRIFSSAMFWTLMLYLLSTFACLFFPNQLAYLLGARDALIPLTSDYIRGLGVGIGFNVFHLALVEFTKLDGSPALGPISIAVTTAVNIILDLISIWLHWGLFGIALATSISFLAGVLVCCIHFVRPVHTLKLVKIPNPVRDLIALCSYGLPRAGNGICFAVTTALMNYRLAFLGGSTALAALSILSSVGLFISSTCLGVGATAQLLSGIFYGEGDAKALEDSVKTSLREGVLITAFVCLIYLIFTNPIIGLYGQAGSDVAIMAVSAVRWKLIGFVIFTVIHVFVNYYQSTDNLKMATFVAVVEALPAQAIYIWILPMFMGVTGVWATPIFSGITTFLVLTLAVCYQNRHFPRTLKDYLLLPSSFDNVEAMQLNISIANNLEAVVGVSEKVYTFCKDQGIDARRTHHLSLCVEEMARNVVQYAFSDQKEHFIDIRIVREGEQMTFRMRDDGSPFNPLKKLSEADVDPTQNIGINLIRALSDSVDYRYTVGLNNLLIKL